MRVTDIFDSVGVGAGSGGGTVAGRLSEDPAISVAASRSGNPVQQIFLQAAQEAQFRRREDFNADEHEASASIN
jgi:choline dehydrogenase-like flavoprotein